MKCYLINLAQDIERLTQFADAWIAPFPFEVVDAFDGRTLLALPSRWNHSAGAYGLFATYEWVFVEALLCDRVSPFAVFEDDAMLAPDWVAHAEAAIAEAPVGWWSINLGAEIEVPGFDHLAPIVVGDHLARMPHAWRTHAVIYNPQAATKMIAAMAARPIPVDQVWCELMLRGSRDFYCTRAFVAGTRAGRSRITDITWDKPYVGPFGLGGAHHRALVLGAQSGA